MDTHRFTARTAVVTGAGSGIGRAAALRPAGEGATVVVVDLSARRLEALVADEPRLPLFPVLADLTDLTDEHAVAGLTKGTALMHAADGIRTDAVAPGATVTGIEAPLGSDLFPGRMAGFLQNIFCSATAEQVAAVIVLLASDDASNVNGVIMPSDGGWFAV